MGEIAKIFGVKEPVDRGFVEGRKDPSALSDYAIKKSIASREIVTGDHNVDGDKPQVVNVVYGTDATPPAAATVPVGTIYIQYTA